MKNTLNLLLTSLLVMIISLVTFNRNRLINIESKEKKQKFDCSSLYIGQKLLVCSWKSDNPFDPQSRVEIVITDIKNGYIQYCRYIDYNDKDKALFNRSCEQFIEQLNRCNE